MNCMFCSAAQSMVITWSLMCVCSMASVPSIILTEAHMPSCQSLEDVVGFKSGNLRLPFRAAEQDQQQGDIATQLFEKTVSFAKDAHSSTLTWAGFSENVVRISTRFVAVPGCQPCLGRNTPFTWTLYLWAVTVPG